MLSVTAWLPAAPQIAAEIPGVAWAALLVPVLLVGLLIGGLGASLFLADPRRGAAASSALRVTGALAVVVGAVLPAVTPTMGWLLAGRALLGAGFGVGFGIVSMRWVRRPDRRAGRSPVVVALAAAVAGPFLGGLIIAGPGWRWLFLPTLLAVPEVLSTLRPGGWASGPPPVPATGNRRVLVLFMLTVLVVIIGLGWPGPLSALPRLVLVGAGLAIIAAIGCAETRYGRVLPVPLTGPDRPGWRAVATVLVAAALGGAATVLPFFYLDVQHAGPLRSGALSALAVAAVLVGALLYRGSDRDLSRGRGRAGFGRTRGEQRPVGARTVAVSVLLVGAVGMLSGLRTSTGVLTVTWASALFGLLVGVLLAGLTRPARSAAARLAVTAELGFGVAAGSALAGRVFGEEAPGALPPALQQLWISLAGPDHAARQPELALAVTHGVTTSLVTVAVVALLGVAATVLARPAADRS